MWDSGIVAEGPGAGRGAERPVSSRASVCNQFRRRRTKRVVVDIFVQRRGQLLYCRFRAVLASGVHLDCAVGEG